MHLRRSRNGWRGDRRGSSSGRRGACSSGWNKARDGVRKVRQLRGSGCCLRPFFRLDCARDRRAGRSRALGRRGKLLVCRDIFSQTADRGADGASRLILRDRLGQNQFRAQAKSGGQTGAAIDNGDRHRIVAAFSASANVKNQFGCRQIFAIDQHQIEAVRIKFLGSGRSVQGTLASYRHLF